MIVTRPSGRLRRTVPALAVVAVLAAGCGRGGDEEATPLPEDESATVAEEEVALQAAARADAVWNCGAVKQHLFALVNTLTAAEAEAEGLVAAIVTEYTLAAQAEAAARGAAHQTSIDVDDEPQLDLDEIADDIEQLAADAAGVAADALDDFVDGASDDDGDPAEGLRVAVEAAESGFNANDEKALNAACELYGQHEAALELWAAGNTGDACDVWVPAKAAADQTADTLDIAAVHPLVSKFWVGATGGIAEGHGRCIAERAN